MRVLFLFLLPLIVLTSCLNDAREKKSEGPDPNGIYYDYRVSAEEGNDQVTVMLQYRYGGENAPSFVLEDPSKVTIDGITLKPDSASLKGIFYELIKPIDSFRGKHKIVFTDSREKEHSVEFSFEPFSLANEIPDEVSKKPFTIQLANFPKVQTKVHLVLMDTSFTTEDVNEEILIENGEIFFDEDKLAKLSKGPVMLEIYKEEVKPLRNASREGGRILITYGIRREFEFVN